MRWPKVPFLDQFVTGVFGPVRTESGDLRIAFEQVLDTGSVVCADCWTCEASSFGHALRFVAIGQLWPIFFAKP